MDSVKKIAAMLAMCFVTVAASAQENSDVMRTNGKIYVVVAVVVTIVIGLFLYLMNLDRKISKIERSQK